MSKARKANFRTISKQLLTWPFQIFQIFTHAETLTEIKHIFIITVNWLQRKRTEENPLLSKLGQIGYGINHN